MAIKEIYKNFISKTERFMELTRGYSLFESLAPWFLGVTTASVSTLYASQYFQHILNVALTFIVVVCTHLAANLFDDYADVWRELKKGTPLNQIDFGNAKGKGRLIINGTYSMKSVLKIIFSLFAISLIIGIYFTFLYGPVIPFIALLTGALCLLYPLSTKYYLGEIIIGLIFGPLLITGTFIALSGIFMPKILMLSVAVGIMVVVLLEAHSLMDFDYDLKVGKKTLCTLTGSKTRALALIGAEITAAYGIILILALTNRFSLWILASVVLTLPLAIGLIKSLDDYNKVKDIKFIPKWFYGPMENWKNIISQHYEYFMYRFYMARNLGLIFCITLAIVCYCTINITYIYR